MEEQIKAEHYFGLDACGSDGVLTDERPLFALGTVARDRGRRYIDSIFPAGAGVAEGEITVVDVQYLWEGVVEGAGPLP